MTSVVARATVIIEFGAEYVRDGVVFNKVGVLAVRVVRRKRNGRYVLSHPGGIASAAIEDGGRRKGGVEVIDWAWEAILKEAVGVDGRSYILQRAGAKGNWR